MSSINTDQSPTPEPDPSRRKRDSAPRLMEYVDDEGPELLGVDPESLDPNMAYRFVLDTPQKMAKRMSQGYRTVSREADGVKLKIDHEQGAAEDLIRIGDTILMQCPKELYEGRRAKIDRLTRNRLKQPESSFRKKARAADINVTDK